MAKRPQKPPVSERVTIRTIRHWVRDGVPFPLLTCYDATTAKWLWRGGVKTLLVGDTAGHVILGHDSTLPVSLDFMLTITAAVRRGAPDAFVMGDMPFGSFQCGADDALRNAIAFVKDAGADAVKLEVTIDDAPLVHRMANAGVPVVAHLGSRPQTVRQRGGYGSVARTQHEAEALAFAARTMAEAGAEMILLEATPAESAKLAVDAVSTLGPNGTAVPVIGCGAGPACHGHVVVLHDLLGMSDWQPPFAPPLANLGEAIRAAANDWAKRVESGRYPGKSHPYRMK